MRISDWSSTCALPISSRGSYTIYDWVVFLFSRCQSVPVNRVGGLALPQYSLRMLVIHDRPTMLRLPAWTWDALHAIARGRSEEHTSDLQSLMRISYDVIRL